MNLQTFILCIKKSMKNVGQRKERRLFVSFDWSFKIYSVGFIDLSFLQFIPWVSLIWDLISFPEKETKRPFHYSVLPNGIFHFFHKTAKQFKFFIYKKWTALWKNFKMKSIFCFGESCSPSIFTPKNDASSKIQKISNFGQKRRKFFPFLAITFF